MKMTLKRLTADILKGLGTGVGDRYSPWIEIKKKNTSKRSNQSQVPMPGLTRHCHFLSRGERDVANVLWWLGVEDLREQFPLWPWPHPHLKEEVDPDHPWERMPGMSDIAREAGIPVYNYPGLSVPAILSIDLLATLPTNEGENHALVGISCKPESVFLAAQPTERERERLELDRRYCVTAEISHLLLHPEQLPPTLIRNLDWLSPLRPRWWLEELTSSSNYLLFVERLRDRAWRMPVHAATREANRRIGWTHDFAQFVTRTAIWRQDLDVNLLQPISMTEPLRAGGVALQRVLRRRLFGRPQWG